METIQSLKDLYRTGDIGKGDFVTRMYGRHDALFEYANSLATTNIAEISIRDGTVVARFRDPAIAMVCPPGDTRSAPLEAFNFGDYECAELRLVRRIVAHLGGAAAAFFDIGANAGFYSLALSHYFAGIRGVAFEPIPSTFALLKQNLTLNQSRGVVAENSGLSDQNGEFTFYAYATLSGASSMTRNVDSAESTEIRCRTRKLDDYCAETGAVSAFIKCDVEGGELRVFEGAEKSLLRDRPAIFSEMLRKWSANFGYHPDDLIGFLARLGYSCFVARGDGISPCASVTAETPDTNFFFLHADEHTGLMRELAS